MSFAISIGFIFCFSFITASQSCMCRFRGLRKDFCAAAIVMKAKITSNATNAIHVQSDNDTFSLYSSSQVYNLKIVEVFKGKEQLNQLAGFTPSIRGESPVYTVELHTPPRFISCSFLLCEGQEYLLSGRLDNNKLSSEFCDIRLEWGDITPRQEYGVRAKYAEDCYDGEIRVYNQFQDQWP